MTSENSQMHQKVQLALSLSTSPPHTISIDDAAPFEPLKLIAVIRQIASPFPNCAVTILTKYSCLETTTTGPEDAFFSCAMTSPQITSQSDQCLAPELPLRPVGKHITITRMSGDPNLLKRTEDPGFKFVTIPPVGQGHTEIVWNLPPEKLLKRLGSRDEPIHDKMKRLLRPRDTYKIVPGHLRIQWWTFGSLGGDEGLEKKKIARWSLPDDLALVRNPGEDETQEMAHRLCDWVDLHNVNKLSSRSTVENEQIPDIGKMRLEGWVFGEPSTGLEMILGNKEGAQFTIV